MKNFLTKILILLCLFVLAFLLYPSPIKPAKYNVPKIKLLKNTEDINISPNVKSFVHNKIHSSEGLAVDSDGTIYTGNGAEILKIFPNEKVEKFAYTGGQNLGITIDKDRNIIVANNPKGLLKIDKQGKITNLLNRVKIAIPIKYPNDVTISSDGIIYFSDSSYKFNGTKQSYYLDLLDARPHGRLFSFNVKTGELKTLLDNLRYANGVALSQNEDFILINESYGYKINKFYLKGPKTGKKEVFIDGLYGYPDGISSDKNGNFYVAIFAPRNTFLDWLQLHPFIKSQITKLPQRLWPKFDKASSILVLNKDGKILKRYKDDSGNIYTLSTVKRYNNNLFIGTLVGKSIWIYKLND